MSAVPAFSPMDPRTIAGVTLGGNGPKFLQPKKIEQALMTLAALPPCDDSEADPDAPAHKRLLAFTSDEKQRLDDATKMLSEALDQLRAADQAFAQAKADAARLPLLESEAARGAAGQYLGAAAAPRPGLADDLEKAQAAARALGQLQQHAQAARDAAHRARGRATHEVQAVLRGNLLRAGEVWAKAAGALGEAVGHAQAIAAMLGDGDLIAHLDSAIGPMLVPSPPVPYMAHARVLRYACGAEEVDGLSTLVAPRRHPRAAMLQSAAYTRLMAELTPSGAHMLVRR